MALGSKKKKAEKTESAKLAEHKVVAAKAVVEAPKAKKEEPKPVASKAREIVSIDVANGKAILKEGGKQFKAKCYLRRKDKMPLIAVGDKSMPAEEWLKG